MKDLLDLVYSFRAKEIDINGFIGGLGQWFNDIGIGGPVTSFMEKSWFPFLAMAVGALCLFYGKKWLGLIKFVSCAAIGFVAGLVISPMLETTLPFLVEKAWITGALCALILAVLNKLIFGLVFFGGPAAGAFAAFYIEGIIPMELPTVGNLPACLGIAAGAALIMLMIRKNFQRIVTAAMGGSLVNLGIKRLYDYSASLPEYQVYIDFGVVALIAIIGFVYPYRRRRRYR